MNRSCRLDRPRPSVRLRQAVTTAAVITLVLVAWPIGAQAATLQATGYWYRGQTGLLQQRVPPPPGVPDNGLAVAAGGEGSTEVSAVRYQLADGETNPVLTLQVNQERGGDIAAIDACRAQSNWQPAHAGRWDNRPTCAEDAEKVAGERSQDGASWTWKLAPLVSDDGLVDVVLQPGQLSQQGQQLPTDASFRITFEPPTEQSLETQSGAPAAPTFSPPPAGGASSSGSTSGAGTAPPPEVDTAPPPPSDDTGGFSSSTGTSGPPPAVDTQTGPQAPSVASPPPAAAPPTQTATTPPSSRPATTTGQGGLDDQFVALLAAGGVLVYAADLRRRSGREPRLLGPFADDEDADGDDGDEDDRPPPLL